MLKAVSAADRSENSSVVFNRYWERATVGFVRWSDVVIRKGAVVLVLLVVCGLAGIFFAKRLPSSFLPDEDQGYVYVSMQLPVASSMERTSEAGAEVEKVLANTPGVQYTTTVIGFNLFSFAQTTYNAFFFVTLKPWGDRKSRDEQYRAIENRLNRELGKLPVGNRFHLLAALNPRRWNFRRISVCPRGPRR